MKKIFLAATIFTSLSQLAIASPEDALLKSLQAQFPENHIDKVLSTPVQGIYEIDSGRDVAYTTKDGRYIFLGLIDTKERKDLTAIRKAQLNKIDFGILPLSNAIKEVRGDGKRTLVVFSDPDCPYCSKLESEIMNLTNVTIYTFEMPITQLHPDSKRKAIAIWCSEDRAKAWNEVVGKRANIADGACQNPIEANLALAMKLGINGTPTLIARDGRLHSGTMTTKEIENWLGN